MKLKKGKAETATEVLQVSTRITPKPVAQTQRPKKIPPSGFAAAWEAYPERWKSVVHGSTLLLYHPGIGGKNPVDDLVLGESVNMGGSFCLRAAKERDPPVNLGGKRQECSGYWRNMWFFRVSTHDLM